VQVEYLAIKYNEFQDWNVWRVKQFFLWRLGQFNFTLIPSAYVLALLGTKLYGFFVDKKLPITTDRPFLLILVISGRFLSKMIVKWQILPICDIDIMEAFNSEIPISFGLLNLYKGFSGQRLYFKLKHYLTISSKTFLYKTGLLSYLEIIDSVAHAPT